METFNLNHDISTLSFDKIKIKTPKTIIKKKPQEISTNPTFELGKIEGDILEHLSARITKTFDNYYKSSLDLHFPKLSSTHEKVDLSKLSMDTPLFEQSYFKYDEKNLAIEMDEIHLKETNKIRNTEKFLKEKSILEGIEKKNLAPNAAPKKQKTKKLDKWFGMEAPVMTPEIKLELEALRLRHTLSGQGKKDEEYEDPTYFQFGTLQEGSTEFFSDRRKKRDRKESFLDEIIHDQKSGSDYINNRFQELKKKKKK
jgi:hypothetical protein